MGMVIINLIKAVGKILHLDREMGEVLYFFSTHPTENPRGLSEVGKNKQLLMAIVVHRFYSVVFLFR